MLGARRHAQWPPLSWPTWLTIATQLYVDDRASAETPAAPAASAAARSRRPVWNSERSRSVSGNVTLWSAFLWR